MCIRDRFVTAHSPSGEIVIDPVSSLLPAGLSPLQSGASWRYDLQPTQSGVYALSVTAIDDAGNSATIGPFEVLVDAVAPSQPAVPFLTFIPLVRRGAPPGPNPPEPETLRPDKTSAGAPPARNGGRHE